jgi:hypothetical protein
MTELSPVQAEPTLIHKDAVKTGPPGLQRIPVHVALYRKKFVKSLHSLKVNSHIPCRSPAMPCRQEFRLCLSHLIYTVRPCLIHTCHAAPVACHDQAVLKATSQGHGTARHGHGTAWHVWISIWRPEMACGRPAFVRLLPSTTRSSTNIVIRIIPIR